MPVLSKSLAPRALKKNKPPICGESHIIADGKVYEHGEQVGTVDDTTLISIAPSGSVAYHYNLRLVPAADGTMELESEYGAQNFLGTLMTVARLRRQ